jgi:hypothetical protein
MAIVAADSVLSAALLRRASSADQVGGKIVTLQAAIVRLGVFELVEIAMAASVGVAATAPGPLSSLRRDAWRCALLSARLCQELARRRGVDPSVAFISGLLHDFGSIVLVAALEDLATQRRLELMTEAAWRDLVARYHVEFGMVVAARWNLPDAIAEVIARHHNADVGTKGLVGLVATVDRVIDVLEHAPEGGLAALLSVPGLDDRDRATVGAALGDASRQLESLELSMPAPKITAATPSAVVSMLPPEDGWPVDFEITVKRERLRVTTIWPDRFAMRGAQPLQPNWLADVVMHTELAPIAFLANVRTCTKDEATGDYIAIAQPYALGGPQKEQWLHLLEAARAAAAS